MPDGSSIATGPVTTLDFREFLFRNTGSDLDLYFSIKKGTSGWEFVWGPSITVPLDFIKQVGERIDRELVVRQPV